MRALPLLRRFAPAQQTGPLRRMPVQTQTRAFAGYTSMAVTGKELEKGADDWVIEETNFNFGRMAPRRFKETEDLARRTKRLLETNPCFMHTRLRDGTCVPYMQPDLLALAEKPFVFHAFHETPLIKWTWDEIYDEALEEEDAPVFYP